MPSILNTPANEIPIHLFRLPIAQREVLLVNILTNPVLYERVLTLTLYHDDPTFAQAIILFRNYILLWQLFSQLAVPRLPVQIAEAFDPALTAARTAILVLLVDWGLDRLLGVLPRDHLTMILCTVILSLSEDQQRAYFRTDDAVEGAVQAPQENKGPSSGTHTDPRSPCPTRASSPTDFLSSTDTAINPIPQLAQQTLPFPPCCTTLLPP